MNRRVSLEQLLQTTALQPPEAVAIIQQLIVTPNAERLTPPLGPPTAATVFIGADGSVSCSTSDSTFAVSELASLLDVMLPSGAANSAIPGGLRYTIARARMEVDAPPFDSLTEFSRALARHERGERTDVIRRMIARANQQSPDGPLDRRSADPAVAQLRRQLRDADARVYDQQRAIDALSMMSTKPRSSQRGVAVAAGILIGLGFAGAGELMHSRPLPPLPPAVVTQTVPDAPAPAASVPQPAPLKSVEAPTTKRASHVTVRSRDREPARPRRFQWLRNRITFRADPL